MKALILFLYHWPAVVRCAWRDANGRLFIFRNESDEFLRYEHAIYGQGEDVPEGLRGFHAQLMAEIALRRAKA